MPWGRPAPIPIENVLKELGGTDHKLPSAVWLSCCYGAGPAKPPAPKDGGEGAGGGTTRAERAEREWGMHQRQAPSIAADLHKQGVPQVLGYFGPVPDPLAARVDRQLFETLMETGSSLEAVRRARLGTKKRMNLGGEYVVFPLAWSLLGLYHRGPDHPLIAPNKTLSRAQSDALERTPLKLSGVEVLQHGFIGRRRLLGQLRKLRKENVRVIGLYGLGGLGKTATMVRLCSILAGVGRDKLEEQVVVLPAAELNEAPALSPFDWLWQKLGTLGVPLAAADQAGERRPQVMASALLEWLGDRILYLDNAETLQDLQAGEPEDGVPWHSAELGAFFDALFEQVGGEATILLTTRYKPAQVSVNADWTEVPPCSDAELLRMTAWWPVTQRLPQSLRVELATKKLAGHPRAVRWVNDLLRMEEQRTGRRVSSGDNPDEVRRWLLNPALAGLPEKAAQDLVLDLVLSRLDDPTRTLLGECTGIGHPVPLEVVDRLGSGSVRLRELGLLTRFGVGEDVWAVHPFVREHAHQATPPISWTQSGRKALGEHWLQRARENKREWAWLEALQQMLAAEAWAEASGVMVTLSLGYRHHGWYRKRHELLQGLAAISAIPWPQEQQAHWMQERGNAFQSIGHYDQAAKHLRRGLQAYTHVYGTRNHAEVASSLHGLANVFQSQGNYSAAAETYQEAIDITVAVHGTRNHAEVASSLHGLANVFQSQGNYSAAAETYQEAIDIKVAVYGTRNHASVASSLHGLANVLQSQGNYSAAAETYQEAIDIQVTVYGTRNHAKVAASLHGLANVLARQGNYSAAAKTYQESIDIKVAVYGTRNHADIAVSLHGLANVLNRQGNYSAAAKTYQEAIDIQVAVYGTRNHASVAASLHGLANVLESQGNYSAAAETYQESIDIKVAVYGTRNHASVAASLHGLANVLVRQGDLAGAASSFREVIGIEERVFGSRTTPNTLPTTAQLAQVLLAQGNAEEAVTWAGEAWNASLQQQLWVLAVQIGPILVNALATQGRIEEARQVGGTVVQILQQFPEDHPVRVSVERQIGLRK